MIEKEFRALLPAWVACAVAMVAASNGFQALRYLAAPAYFIGAASIGALSIGHEYNHGTLNLLLSQPVSRPRVLLTKLGVLAVMLGGLIALATVTVTLGTGEALFGRALLWLPLLAALFVAPWLTMAGRSALGGAVFTLSIPGVALVIGEWIGVSRYGYSREVDTFRLAFLYRTMVVLSVVGAAMTWWTFVRLEAFDGRGTDVDLAPGLTAASRPAAKRPVLWLLVRKELRIQQLAFAIAGIYLIGFLALAATNRGRSGADDIIGVLGTFYCLVVALTIGALPSAEERQLRTLDAQLLLPLPAWRQWAVKAGLALMLTLLLAIALPLALLAIAPPEAVDWVRAARPLLRVSFSIILLGLTALSLYVSSLSSSGLWALMASMPAAIAIGVFLLKLASMMEDVVHSMAGPGHSPVTGPGAALLALLVIVLVLRLAFANHRSGDRRAWRIGGQIAVILSAIVAAVMVVGAANVLNR